MRKYFDAFRARAGKIGTSRISWIITGLIITFSVGFFGWMLWRYLPSLLAYHWKLQVMPLILGLPIYTLDLLMVVIGWSFIMGKMAEHLAFRAHFRIFVMSQIAGHLPGPPWQIVGRAALYKRLGVSARVTTVASGLEMILIIVSGIISSALIGLSLPENLLKYRPWLLLVAVIGLVLMHPAVVRKILHWLGRDQEEVRLRYRDMLLLLIFYVLVWAVGGCVLYMIILALYPLSWTQLPGVIGAWGLSGAVATILSLSPSSFGIKEIALSLLLGIFIPAGIALVIAILIRLYLTAAEFVGAIVASRL